VNRGVGRCGNLALLAGEAFHAADEAEYVGSRFQRRVADDPLTATVPERVCQKGAGAGRAEFGVEIKGL